MPRVAFFSLLLLLPLLFSSVQAGPEAPANPARPIQIPKVWDEAQLAAMDLPLPNTAVKMKHVSPEYYYRLEVRPIYKSYPVYHPDREPAGYLEWLKQQEPEIAFDPAKLKTEQDWIQAGELVFEAPLGFNGLAKLERVRDPKWYAAGKVPVGKDGVAPFFRYVIREKGKVEVGEFSCATCHSRVMSDGSTIKGAQGNFPLEHLDEIALKERFANPERPEEALAGVRRFTRSRFATPWIQPDPLQALDSMSIEDIATAYGQMPAGVQARDEASILIPVQVPDLIGIKDRRYFDRTGRSRHRDISDLMRYAAFVQGAFSWSSYGDYLPAGSLPEPPRGKRYSDEQLYALALYLYSLEFPENPHKPDALSQFGQQIFVREGCEGCHTPPLYSSNKLTPTVGFEVPEDHPAKADILPFSVGTDPALTLRTRKGTGLYKVPSLRGVWYRGPLEHSGSVATLEDWFDPRRLRDDYVPTGWVGYKVQTRAVSGHKFGLDLSEKDRKALIAFLRTL